MVQVGTPAPEFELPDQAGRVHKLADYRGKWLVLFFYPKDDTPGCTKEACAFRDARADLAALSAEVVGISILDAASKRQFADKYQLNFPLLADEDHAVAEAYGAWQEKSRYGKTFMGVARVTCIIDPDGNVARAYAKVKPEEHAEQIAKDLRALQEPST